MKQWAPKDEDVVLSEVHLEDCPPGQRRWTTVFAIKNLGKRRSFHKNEEKEEEAFIDDDGDLVLPRRPGLQATGAAH
jgi:hypothetical protein